MYHNHTSFDAKALRVGRAFVYAVENISENRAKNETKLVLVSEACVEAAVLGFSVNGAMIHDGSSPLTPQAWLTALGNAGRNLVSRMDRKSLVPFDPESAVKIAEIDADRLVLTSVADPTSLLRSTGLELHHVLPAPAESGSFFPDEFDRLHASGCTMLCASPILVQFANGQIYARLNFEQDGWIFDHDDQSLFYLIDTYDIDDLAKMRAIGIFASSI